MIHVGRIRRRINIETDTNPINLPLDNVYGVPKLTYHEYLRKEKKKFPNCTGNNIANPTYLQISYLNNNKYSLENNPKHGEGLKHFDIKSAIKTEVEKPRGRKRFENMGTETSQNLGYFSTKKSYNFLPRRSYNILSGKDEPPLPEIPSQRGFFSNLAYLNFIIEQDKRNDKVLQNRKKFGLNDGIYDYLEKNNYV